MRRLLMSLALVVALFVASAPAQAPAPKFAAESLALIPEGAKSGAADLALTILATDGQLFARPAGKSPELEFGAGVTVKAFFIDSPKQARATITVDAAALGAIDARIKIFGMDGTTVVTLAQTSFGALGPATIGPVKITVTENKKINTDVPAVQPAGDFTFEGPVNGLVTIAAPKGTAFVGASAPVATSQTPGISVTQATVSADGAGVSFTINNPRLVPAKIAMSKLNLDASNYTSKGGAYGNMPFTLSSSGLTQAVTISSAHTPGRTVQNPDSSILNPAPPATATPAPTNTGTGTQVDAGTTPDPTDPADNPNATTGTGTNGAKSASNATNPNATANPNANTKNNRNNRNTNQARAQQQIGQAMQMQSAQGSFAGQVRQVDQGQMQPGQPPAQPGQPAAPGAAPPAMKPAEHQGAWDMRPVVTIAEASPASSMAAGGTGARMDLRVASVVIADRAFAPVRVVGFKPASDGSGKLVATLWLEIKAQGSNAAPASRREIMVRLDWPTGAAQSVPMLETAPGSGVFRCSASGVAVALDWPK